MNTCVQPPVCLILFISYCVRLISNMYGLSSTPATGTPPAGVGCEGRLPAWRYLTRPIQRERLPALGSEGNRQRVRRLPAAEARGTDITRSFTPVTYVTYAHFRITPRSGEHTITLIARATRRSVGSVCNVCIGQLHRHSTSCFRQRPLQAWAMPRPRAPGVVTLPAERTQEARQPPALSRSRTHAHPARGLAGAGPEAFGGFYTFGAGQDRSGPAAAHDRWPIAQSQ